MLIIIARNRLNTATTLLINFLDSDKVLICGEFQKRNVARRKYKIHNDMQNIEILTFDNEN